MNYIKHLSSVLIEIAGDSRLKSTHVSMYIALFQIWNQNRFENPISINRSDTMNISKIGSRVTYHKCLRDLSEWNYIKYYPSHNPMIGSLIHMYNFGTTSETSSEPTTRTTSETSTEQVGGQLVGQVVDPSINSINIINKTNNKKNKSFYIPSIEEVKEFFENDLEADKYFNYYTSKGWVVGNKSPMKDWKAAARNWKMNAGKFSSNNKTGSASSANSRLHVEQNKDYSIPL
jgi:hypothetical protein